MVYRNAMRLQKLVNSLLDFAKVEAGRQEVFFQPTDIAGYTLQLASVFRSAIERAGLKFVTKGEDIQETVYINREMWEKIVLNLVSNAFKFTHGGKIEVVLRSKKKWVELHVRDTGIGISAENLPKIFERFKRIEGAKARAHEGTGIGLALVKDLVTSHGGMIKVKSELGMGTEFIVAIPKGKGHIPARQIYESPADLHSGGISQTFADEITGWLPDGQKRRTHHGSTELHNRTENISKPLILIADDNADMRNYLESILRKDYTVLAVENGARLRQHLDNGIRPDLILSDVMMPETDGMQLAQTLKQDHRYFNIPLILLSARAAEADKIEGMETGADDYLIKPFSARELTSVVKARLDIGRAQNEASILLSKQNADLEAKVAARTAELESARELLMQNNKHLQQVLDAIPQMVWVLDRNGEIRYVNDRWYAYTGIGIEQCVAASPLGCGIIHSSQQKEVSAHWAHCLNSGERFGADLLVRDHQGNFKWNLYIMEPILSSANVVEMWVGTFTDVHLQFLSEKSARESKELLEAVFNSSPNGISVLTPVYDDHSVVIDFTWSLSNSRMTKLTGEKVLNGKRLLKDFPQFSNVFGKLKEVLQTGRLCRFEQVIPIRGNEFWFEYTAVKLEDSIVVTQQNITDGVLAQKRLLALNESLEQKNHELKIINDEVTNLAFIASHDLREPLRKIQFFSDALETREDIPEKAKEYCNKIATSVARMNALIEDVFAFSKMSSPAKGKPSLVNLNNLIQNLISNDLAEFIGRAGARVHASALPEVVGNQTQLTQLFMNLIVNAIKFQPKGNMPSVEITSEVVPGSELIFSDVNKSINYIRVDVADNGIGFENIYSNQIFRMFQRLHGRGEYTGTGMGLAICRKVMENHSGFIRAQGKPGEGAIFSCFFPSREG